jgi:hypothetical protein
MVFGLGMEGILAFFPSTTNIIVTHRDRKWLNLANYPRVGEDRVAFPAAIWERGSTMVVVVGWRLALVNPSPPG